MRMTEEKWSLVRETLKKGRLSVIMPIFNLEESVVENIKKTAELFDKNAIRTEIIPVDDGSVDETAQKLSSLKGLSFNTVSIQPVFLKMNGGKGAALRAGFAASSGDFVLLLDGDLDINPKQTAEFFFEMSRHNADVVVGSKRHKRSLVQYPWHRRIVSWVYFSLVRFFVGLKLTDTQTGMKLFKRDVLEEALSRMLVKTYAFDLELLSIAASRGAKIVEAPVVIRFGDKFGALKLKTVYQMAKDSAAVFYRLKVLKYYASSRAPRKLENTPKISIVIACPNRSWMLDECLEAIAIQTWRNFETIILPDFDFTLDENLKQKTNARIIPTGKVRPAQKRNMGIKDSSGDIVAFIDDDAYPDAHWLEYAVRFFSEPSIGAVGGPGVTPPGDRAFQRLGGRVYDNILVSGNYRYRYKAGGIRRDVDDYPSCNLFVRKPLLDSIGGYRADFWPGEDTLLCKDIIDCGRRIVYDPWVVVYHHRRALFLPHLRQLGRYAFHRGYFCRKYPSNSLHLSYFIPSLFVLYISFYPVVASITVLPGSLAYYLCVTYVFLLAFYFALVFLSSFSFNPVSWVMTAVGIFCSHLWYGIKFIQGLFARKAPCEYIGKDHPNE